MEANTLKFAISILKIAPLVSTTPDLLPLPLTASPDVQVLLRLQPTPNRAWSSDSSVTARR